MGHSKHLKAAKLLGKSDNVMSGKGACAYQHLSGKSFPILENNGHPTGNFPFSFLHLQCYALPAVHTRYSAVPVQCAFHCRNAHGKDDGSNAGKRQVLQKERSRAQRKLSCSREQCAHDAGGRALKRMLPANRNYLPLHLLLPFCSAFP